ncbi:MAG: ABC transporter permease [Rhodobacteraceae bacterium]|nr:ABC transporter permease [Paracoccaceae bacterium]
MTPSHPASPPATRSVQDRLIALLIRFFRAEWSGALLAIVVLGLAIEVATTDTLFFRPSNLMTILNNSAAIGVVAAGMTLIILTAGIDLSVGSVMGLTAALTGYVASFWGFSPAMAIATGLGLGLLVGAFNGTLVAYFGMPAFIVTLAGLSIWRGTGHLATGAQATPKLPEAFDYFGRYNPFAGLREAYRAGELQGFWAQLGSFVDSYWLSFFRTFQMSMLIFIVFFVVLSILIANTRYGRYVYAIGSNEPGARQAGINTRAYLLMTYMFGSFAAAFGALLFLGRAPYAKSDYGQMWELDAIAAVVIGGTSLFGGRGSLWGTFMGVILLKLINNGLTLAQLNTFWQMVVTGGIILVAVGIDIVRQSRDPGAVRKLLAAVGAFMAFLSLMTPASQWLGAQISVLEHERAAALREAGGALAPGHTARLMDPAAIEAAQATAAANLPAALALLVLSVLAGLNVFGRSDRASLGLAVLFLAAIPLLVMLNYHVSTPFLVLGALVVAASAFVFSIFERARRVAADG